MTTLSQSFVRDRKWRRIFTGCGIFIICLTIAIGAFLVYRGTGTFTIYHHTLAEFLFSSDFNPSDSLSGETGTVGAAVFIVGSLETCALALLIAVPFAIAAAILMVEIAPKIGQTILRPAVEIYVGIPSVVYGWLGLTVLVPWIKDAFDAPKGGFSVLAAGLVLAIMIFPTIATAATDALMNVPAEYKEGAYGLGSTRWQMIHKVALPAARSGILVGIILGLARAFGEALAVAMVIGKTRSFAQNLLYPTSNLTAAISADMGNTANGGEHNLALWSMALLLYVISLILIFLIHYINNRAEVKK